jgi:outer membrane protein OmpA-like peptidoglycan-associated protein
MAILGKREMKYILSFVLPLLFTSYALAQPYGDSKFKQKFNKADALVFNGSYMEALPLLEEMYKFDTVNANLNYLLGVSYMLGKKNYPLAIKRLESSTKDVSLEYNEANWKERKAPGIAYYYLGRAYHFKNQFARAITNYYNYRSYIEMDDVATYNQVRQQIQYAENAIELTKNPVSVKATNLGVGINTKYSDYCPVVSADGQVLIFTSRREGGVSDVKDEDGNYYDDIFICNQQSNGAWSKPKSIGNTINTAGHEAAIGLSPNGQLLFIYKDDNGDGNIYFSEKKGDGWSSPQLMESDINTASWETHASVNATEDFLVFVSNRPDGGFGGRDLWYCRRLPNGEWALAQNMGSVINSQYEEDSPFISADGKTLIFSSQGHTSMGGFDIFRSEFVDGAWSAPENIGYPISSSEDDVFFVLTPDGRHAYYSSRKDGGFGDTDIYKLRLEVKKKTGSAVARGIMKVPAMDYANIKAKIVVTDEGGAEVGTYLPNKNSGYYVLILSSGETYDVSYQADGYETIVAKLPVADSDAYADYDGVLELEEVVFGENILALQKETERLEKEKEDAIAKAAEDKLLASELAANAVEEAKQLAVNQGKEAELRKAEELAQAETEKAAEDLAAEQENARLADLERKKAEAKFEAQEVLANQKKQLELTAKQEAEKANIKAAEQENFATETLAQKQSKYLAEQQAVEAKGKAKQEAEEEKLTAGMLAEEQGQVGQDALQAVEKKKKAEEEADTKLALEQDVADKAAEQQALLEADKAAKTERLSEMAAAKKAQEELEIQRESELTEKEAAGKELARLEKEKASLLEQELAAKKVEEAESQEKLLEAQKTAEAEASQKQAEQAAKELAEKAEEEKRAKYIVDAEKRRMDLQKRIEGLKEQKESQQDEVVAVAEVKEVSIKNTESNAEQPVRVDADAIKAKRAIMLKRIEELKNQRADVEVKKTKDEEVVTITSENLEEAIVEKKGLESEAEAKKIEMAELERELQGFMDKVEDAEVKVVEAEAEKAAAEAALRADEAEAKRLVEEEERKVAEAQEVEKQLKELAEQERQRLESERIAANQFKKQQLEEAVRTQRELIQMEALADQQRQVQAAMEAEERKKAAMDAADKSAFTDEERLANATTMEQLREINQKIIADNLELKKQLAQLNFKLDKILARLDYQPDMEKVEIPASSTMRNLQGGKRLILRNIYFDYNLASLRSKSKYELNKLFNFMKGSPDVEIVVSGHTDSKGNDDYNFRLSKDRAQAVVDYLIRNGISSSRLSAQGYGETRPIARNENPDLTDNPVGRQLNRRIEISMAQGREKGVEVEQVEIPNEAQIK